MKKFNDQDIKNLNHNFNKVSKWALKKAALGALVFLIGIPVCIGLIVYLAL